METEALEKALAANLTRVNEWVRFAETKNAALLTFSSAWLVAVCSLWSNGAAPLSIKWAGLLASPAFFAAALTALVSILPQNQSKRSGDTAQQLTVRNMLFHGNISRIELSAALNTLSQRYKPLEGATVSVHLLQDLSTQLVETSRIAQFKLALFTRGTYCVLAGFIVAAATLLFILAGQTFN